MFQLHRALNRLRAETIRRNWRDYSLRQRRTGHTAQTRLDKIGFLEDIEFFDFLAMTAPTPALAALYTTLQTFTEMDFEDVNRPRLCVPDPVFNLFAFPGLSC